MNRKQRRLLDKAKGDPERAREIAHSRSMNPGNTDNVSERMYLAGMMDEAIDIEIVNRDKDQ